MRIVAVVQIVIGLAYFDSRSFNNTAICVLMCLGGSLTLMMDIESPPLQKARRILGHLTLVAGIAFIIKLLVVG